jgi:hypothetical protein
LKMTSLHMFETLGISVISFRKGILNHTGAETSKPHSTGPGTSVVHNWLNCSCGIGGYQSGIAEDLLSCQTQNVHGRLGANVNRKGMGKKGSVPVTGLNWPRGWIEVHLYPFLTSALKGGGWSAPRPGRFTPEKDPISIVKEAGWAPGPVWTVRKNLAHIGIRSPDRPVRSQSLYRLSYPAERNG